MDQLAPYFPPAPKPASRFRALASAIAGRRDLLALFPSSSYNVMVGKAPISRRPIFIVNNPKMVRAITINRVGAFPKSDLMVGALEPLVGDGIFISNGRTWKRQRRLIDPAFAHMRIKSAFDEMARAVTTFEARLDAHAASGDVAELDEEMSHLTADIIFRTIFSEPIESADARAVFRAFSDYQNAVAQIEPWVLLTSKPWGKVRQPSEVVRKCALIRETLGVLIDKRLADGGRRSDIAGDIIAARHPQTGEGFSREELIDQIAVFFLAGHETSASALTWAFFILAERPEILARLREEVDRIAGAGPISFDHTRRLPFTRNVFREVLRLYPPVSFITRIAERSMRLGMQEVPRGALMVISPWLIHRHRKLWTEPDRFDPDRFAPERERELKPGAYIPFGLGPRVCTGASFATVESVLILAALARRYDFKALNAAEIRPVGRLTTRTNKAVHIRFSRRG